MAHFQDHYNTGPIVHTYDHRDTAQQLDTPHEVGRNGITSWQGVPSAIGPYDKESTTLGDMLQLSGSSGSEGNTGQHGGRRKMKKKGMRARVKVNMPGSKGGEYSHTSPTTMPGGYYVTGEESRPKGILGKIKERLLGPQRHHQHEEG